MESSVFTLAVFVAVVGFLNVFSGAAIVLMTIRTMNARCPEEKTDGRLPYGQVAGLEDLMALYLQYQDAYDGFVSRSERFIIMTRAVTGAMRNDSYPLRMSQKEMDEAVVIACRNIMEKRKSPGKGDGQGE